MLSKSDLQERSEQDLLSCDIDSLVDLHEITIDTDKTVVDRVRDYIEQVKNPYLFKIGDITVKVNYRNGKFFLFPQFNFQCEFPSGDSNLTDLYIFFV